MLNSPSAPADAQERVVLVWDVSNEFGSRRDDRLEVRGDAVSINARGNSFEGDRVRNAFDVEMQLLKIAEHSGAIVKQIEIRRGERVELAGHRVKAVGHHPVLI